MMDSGKDAATALADKAAPISRANRFIRLWLDGVRTCFPTEKGISTIPYPGLRSFVPELNQFFCARDVQKDALHSFFAGDGSGGLGPRRLTFVVGGSGSGKSSLTRAGLIAELGSRPTKDYWGAWYVAEMRPATDPVAQLQEALWKDVLRPLIDAFFPEKRAEESAWGGMPSKAMPLDRLVSALRSLGIELGETPTHEEVVAQVDRWLEEKISPRPGLISSTGLFSFVAEALSALDLAASAGERGGPPMLLLHIDQFEEVFRDECNPAGRASLIGLLRDIHNFRPEWLFAVATMRSEELHRLSEHPGMAEAINTSLFLVELVGNDNIESAIVEPARRMAQRWEVPLADFMEGNKAPYTAGAVQELKDAYREADSVLEHKADKLPLLQHALPLIWSAAVRDWIERRDNDPGAKFVIDVGHLQKVSGWNEAESTESKSRLGRCLNKAAESAYDEAVRIFVTRLAEFPVGPSVSPVEQNQSQLLAVEAKGILTVALNCLAQLDDRRNAVRRFVPLSEMLKSAAGIERLQTIARATLEKSLNIVPEEPPKPALEETLNAALRKSLEALEEALKAALGVFERAGLVERLVDEDPETEDLYNVTHESLIRNWVSYLENLKQQGLLQKRLHTFTRPDFRLKNDEDYGFLARRLKRNWAEAASAIQKLSRDALKLALGERPLYSKAWTDSSIRRSEKREKSPPVEENELSRKLTKLSTACDNAEKWETNEDYFTSLERKVTYGMGVLGVGALALAFTAWLSVTSLRESNTIREKLDKSLAESNAIRKQLNTISWLNDFILGQFVKNAVHDRMLAFMLLDAKETYRKGGGNEEAQYNLRKIISLLDTSMRGVYEAETVVSFESPVDSRPKGNAVQCSDDFDDPTPPRSLSVPVKIDEIFGLKCTSGSGRWELTFAWWRDNPSINIKRKLGVRNDGTEDVRLPRSQDSLLRLSKLRKEGLSDKIKLLKAGDIGFYEGDGIVSFRIAGPFGEDGMYLWTTSGLTYADVSGGAGPQTYTPCTSVRNDPNTCEVTSFDLDGDGKTNEDLLLVAAREPRVNETDSVINQVEIRFVRETSTPEEQAIVQSKIFDRGAKIKEVAFHDGWLWLRDVTKAERRYLIREEDFVKILKARWRGVAWRANDEFGIEFRVPKDCERLDRCRAELEDPDDEDSWPGQPTSQTGGSDP